METRDKIVVENLTKRYSGRDGEVTALEDISFSVTEHEFLTLLGPSGCGKSTLLFLLGGLLEPTSGTVSLDGKPIRGPGADRGVVFQDYALLPWYTAGQNIALGPKFKGVGKEERREKAHYYLDLFGLGGFADRYPHELSGGMRQRVAVAQALANEPEVVLMDEPFGALDAQTRDTLSGELARISSELTMTTVFVTHDIDEAVFLGDRILIMSPRPGRVHSVKDVPIPRSQRTWSDMRTDDRFLHLTQEVGQIIRTMERDRSDS